METFRGRPFPNTPVFCLLELFPSRRLRVNTKAGSPASEHTIMVLNALPSVTNRLKTFVEIFCVRR